MVPELLTERRELLDKINLSMKELNSDFSYDPNSIQIETIRKLISNLVEVHRSLEQQKVEIPRGWWVKHRVKILVGFAAVANVAFNVMGWLQFQPSRAASNTTSSIPEDNVLPAASTLLALGIVLSSASIILSFQNDKKDKEEQEIRNNLNSVMQIKEVGEETFQKFLQALNEFKKTAPQERSGEQIKNCVKHLKKIPIEEVKSEIKEETIIPNMIESMGANNPLHIDFENLKKAADQIREGLSSTESLSEDLRTLSSSDDDSFSGEKGIRADSIAILKKKSITPIAKYRKKWKKLENALGPINRLKVNEFYLTEQGVSQNEPADDLVIVIN